MKLLDAAREFFVALWHVLPRALWAESVAWLFTFAILVAVFKTLKTTGAARSDEVGRRYARLGQDAALSRRPP